MKRDGRNAASRKTWLVWCAAPRAEGPAMAHGRAHVGGRSYVCRYGFFFSLLRDDVLDVFEVVLTSLVVMILRDCGRPHRRRLRRAAG
jgi:hypothetical protein